MNTTITKTTIIRELDDSGNVIMEYDDNYNFVNQYTYNNDNKLIESVKTRKTIYNNTTIVLATSEIINLLDNDGNCIRTVYNLYEVFNDKPDIDHINHFDEYTYFDSKNRCVKRTIKDNTIIRYVGFNNDDKPILATVTAEDGTSVNQICLNYDSNGNCISYRDNINNEIAVFDIRNNEILRIINGNNFSINEYDSNNHIIYSKVVFMESPVNCIVEDERIYEYNDDGLLIRKTVEFANITQITNFKYMMA